MPNYTIGDKTYSIDDSQVDEFLSLAEEKGYKVTKTLESSPDFQNPTMPGAVVGDSIAPNTGFQLGSTLSESQEDDTFIERALGKNLVTDFFGDIYRAGVQGFQQSQAVGENIDVFNKGVDADDKTILNFIRANKKAQGSKMSDEMRDFSRIYEEEGKVFGVL
jgi:hypothetical protein